MSRRPLSLRWRLLAATMVALTGALLLAGWMLTALFRAHATQQFEASLRAHLDQLTALADLTGTRGPTMDTAALTDPRWQRPYSGLYWQMDGPSGPAMLRSRSLWDTQLALPADTLRDGQDHAHAGTGPQGRPVWMLERAVHPAEQPQAVWRLVVAADTTTLDVAVAAFRGQLAASLAVLLALLALAAWAQVAVGLAPLQALRQALDRVRTGQTSRLEGTLPIEVQPLVDSFNSVLADRADMVARARQHAGNLAHAIKTPLTLLQQGASQGVADPALARQMHQQIDQARRHVDWHLARARLEGRGRQAGWGTPAMPLAPIVHGLVRVMDKVHAERGLQWTAAPFPSDWAVQAEEQDLQEMLGNLLDNAGKWARTRVHTEVTRDALSAKAPGNPMLHIHIQDDGPGIAPALLGGLPQRGARLDEAVPGSGLGLAITQDLAQSYGGQLRLQAGAAGGLQATLSLPLAGSPPPASSRLAHAPAPRGPAQQKHAQRPQQEHKLDSGAA